MHTKAIGVRAVVGLATLALLGSLGFGATAEAAPPPPPALSITPLPGIAAQTMTIGPADASGACDLAEVDLLYYDFNFNQHSVTITLDPNDPSDDMWADQPKFDAGQYRVIASCSNSQQPNAGHLGASQTGFSYGTQDFLVNGEINAPNSATVGATIEWGPKDHSLCPDGTVALAITNPDGSVTIPLAPTVDGTGSWSAAQAFATPGTYVLAGTCSVQQHPSAGHRSVGGILQSDLLFNYLPHPVVVSDAVAPVVPATPETPAAEPVVAAANFTG